MARIRLPNLWKPRDYQLPLWNYLERGGRHAEAVWHRRSGKDDVALNRTGVAGFERIGNYWHMLPEYAQARKAIWDAVDPHTGRRRIDQAFPHEIRKATREQEMQIVFVNGSTWQVVGSDSFDRLVGSTPCGIVWSEWALANPAARAYLRPIIAENNGWQLFITTPRGRNHAHTTLKAAERDPAAFAQILDAEQTGVFTPEQLAAERAAYIAEFGEEYGMAKFEQEYMCSFDAANMGAILARSITKAEREGRVGPHVEYDPQGAPIEISCDLGRRDTSTWWFWQPKIGGFSIVDYDGGWGLDAEEWCDRIEEKLVGRKLGTIWLPHDARAKTFSAKRSALETFVSRFGVTHVDITPDSSIPDRVNAARVLISRCEFSNSADCERGLDGLRAWSYDYNDDTKIFSQVPKHDWACFVAGTEVKTTRGDVPIEAVKIGDEVLTPAGIDLVSAVHSYQAEGYIEITLADGRVIRCTGNHKLFSPDGLLYADGLEYGQVLFSGREMAWRAISWITKASGITGIHQAITDTFQQESRREKGRKNRHYIGTYGQMLMARFLMAAKSIMLIATRATMPLQTSLAFQGANISGCMAPTAAGSRPHGMEQTTGGYSTANWQSEHGNGIGKDRKGMPWLRSELPAMRRKNGTDQMLGGNGIQSTANESGKNGRQLQRFARFAVRLLLHIGRIEASTAGRIVALKRFDGAQKVYDITVARNHCYIANGVLSSNSHDGDGFSYGCLIMQQTKPPAVVEPIVPRGAVTVDQFIAMGERKTRREGRI